MSTSLLYHGFGVRDYRYVRTQYVARGCGVYDRAEAGDLSLCGLRLAERVAARGGRAAVSYRADRQQTGRVGGENSSAGVPGLRSRSPGGHRLCRAETDLHQVV